MPTAAEKWAQVSDEEKVAVIRDFEELKADDERIRNANTRQLQPHETPHGLGDHEWPVAPSHCAHLCHGQRLSQLAQTRHSKFGHRIEVNAQAVTCDETVPPRFYTCGECFGAFNCREDFTADDRERQTDLRDSLNLMQRLHKSAPRKMVLAIAHHLDIPADEDHYPCIFVCSLCGLYNSPEKQMYNYCRCIGPPIVGSALELQRMSYANNASQTLYTNLNRLGSPNIPPDVFLFVWVVWLSSFILDKPMARQQCRFPSIPP